MKHITFILAFFLIVSFKISAQAPKYSNEFLAIGVGAKALAMSNSVVSITDDATSGYWNPAGLIGIKQHRQLALMHAEYFAGIAKYDYAAFAAKIDDRSAVAFSYIRFGVDDIPNTTELIDSEGNINYDRISSFSATDNAFIASYARKHKTLPLRFGANAKIIHRKIGDFASSWGFGLDIGIQYDGGKWSFGAVAKDITSTFNAWSFSLSEDVVDVFTLTGNEIPENSLEVTLPRLILGTARKIKLSEKFSSLLAVDLDMTFDGKRNTLIKSDPVSIDPHLGLEIAFQEFIFFRAGAGNIQEETDFGNQSAYTFQPNMGIGIKIKDKLILDYALTDIGDNSVALYSNVFSLTFNISKKTGT